MTLEELETYKIEPVSHEVYQAVKRNWDRVAKPLDGLGQFEELLAKIGAAHGSAALDISRKAVIVMCADHGIVAEHVSQSPQTVTAQVAECMGQNRTSVGKMAQKVGADVIVVDIGMNSDREFPGVINRKIRRGTGNFYKESAMSEQEALAALKTGIDLAASCRKQGFRLIGTGEMGIGNTAASSAVAAALLGCPAAEVTGKGAGLSEEGLKHKRRIIQEALTRYQFRKEETLRILATVGGLDIAGLAGVCIGGALNRLPVVLDGFISSVAALTAKRLLPGVEEYLIPSHKSREPAAERILKELGLSPVLDAGMALGEGTGAVMMFALLDMALALYEAPTTFSDMAVEPYRRFEPEKGSVPC